MPKPSAIEVLLVAGLLVCTWKYFWLMDDAFIYFRYVDNLLFLHRGLVFNPGELVEGFTSPFWLGLLVPLRWLELDYWTICRGIAMVAALCFGALLVAVNRALRPGQPIINLPLAIAAGHYGIATHFSSGLETPLVHVWAALIALWLLRPGAPLLQVACGLAPLVRPELGPVVLLAGAFAAYRTRRFPSWFATSLLGFNACWLLFRIYYYAELLPNTFYLKDGQLWQQGLWYLWNGIVGQWWVAFVLAAWTALFILRSGSSPRHLPERAMMVTLAAIQLLWVAKVGGDMIYHRFLAAPTVLLLCSTGGLAERVVSALSEAPPRSAGALSLDGRRKLIAASALSLLAFVAAFVSYPPQLSSHPWTEPNDSQWHSIEDATWHRRHPQLAPRPTRARDDQVLLQLYRVWNQQQHPPVFAMVHPWCRRAFFEFRRYIVHEYGLTDPVLARIVAPITRPGHRQLGGFAHDLLAVVERPELRGADMFRKAVDQGRAAIWITANLHTIELIARKAYNHHHFFDNLRLALTPVPRIRP